MGFDSPLDNNGSEVYYHIGAGLTHFAPKVSKMAREVKKGYQNPILYRFNQFTDYYNAEKSKVNAPLGDKIRCGKYRYAVAVLLAYHNENKDTIVQMDGKHPDYLPSLFTNNVELKERTLIEDKSTSWRCIEWLCDLSVGDGIGKFMTKQFHGRKNDYQIRINPFFTCGKVVLNWGEPTQNLTNEASEEENEKALETLLKSALIAKCNLPTFSKTDINVYKTTTSTCGKVENISSTQKQQQKHFAKTSGGSLTRFEDKDTSLSTTAKTKAGGAGENSKFQNSSSTMPIGTVYGFAEKGHNRTDIQGSKTSEKPKMTRLEQVEAYSAQLIDQFFDYSTKLLYPDYRFSKGETLKIKEIINNSWYKKGVHAQTMRADLDKHQEAMFELVTIALQEVENNPQFSYIHANAKVFFDHKFQHGLVRSYQRYKKNKIARDLNLVLTAQKSVKFFKIPRGVKTVHTLPQLITYWQHRLDTQSFNKESTLKSFNIFLTNPKNLTK